MNTMACRGMLSNVNPFEDLPFHVLTEGRDHRAIPGKSENLLKPIHRAVRDGDAIVLEVELPGLDKNTLELNVDRRRVIIAGTRPYPTGFGRPAVDSASAVNPKQDNNAPRTDVVDSHGEQVIARPKALKAIEYYKAFTLQQDVDVDAVKAEWDAGILRIRLPQLKATQSSRRVEVSMAE
jgi:HSP20 family molecular chaperone IbpA